MKALTIEAATLDSAYGLCSALSTFGAEMIEADARRFLVKVDLSGGSSDIVAILNAIERYVRMRDCGPALIDLDGRSYMLEAQNSLRDAAP